MAFNKTISKADLLETQTARQAALLKSFAWKMFLSGSPFAVNGVSKWRWRIRWNKLWEYSRGLGLVPWQKGWKVLDFGGGATLPVYYLANEGLRVASYDIDTRLTGEARDTAAKKAWPLEASARNLITEPLAEDGTFDWVMSFCVLEHLPRQAQLQIAQHLGRLLKPGGYMTVTFDYSPEAPVEGALRSREDVLALLQATGLQPVDGVDFEDSGERFELDKKYPGALFTFGFLLLRKA